MDAMIVVLWAAMFLCTFHDIVLARHTDALIPTLLMFTAGGHLGKLVDYIRREQLGLPGNPGRGPAPLRRNPQRSST